MEQASYEVLAGQEFYGSQYIDAREWKVQSLQCQANFRALACNGFPNVWRVLLHAVEGMWHKEKQY